MARPIKCRKVEFFPKDTYFVPLGKPNCGSQKVNCSKKQMDVRNGVRKVNCRRGREIEGTKDNNFN